MEQKKPALKQGKVSARSFLYNEVMADSKEQESGTSTVESELMSAAKGRRSFTSVTASEDVPGC